MAKLSDIKVTARHEVDDTVRHSATYPCSVDSRGMFRADIPADIYEQLQGLCGAHRDLACKVSLTAGRGGRGARHVVESPQLSNLERLLHLYSKAMCEADVTTEVRLFYTLRLGVSYYRTGTGEILPNGQGVPDYGKDGGHWYGEGQHSGFGRGDQAAIVGVGASIARVTTVTPKNGSPATSYDRTGREELGEWGLALTRWINQPFPQSSRGEASGMRSVPYDEATAKLFNDVISNLARIAEMLRTHLDDHKALPALVASGGLRLLPGPGD